MKNWNTKKTIWTLVIIAILVAIYMYRNEISNQWKTWFPGEEEGAVEGANQKTIGQQRCQPGYTWRFDSLNQKWGCYPA